MAPTYIYDMAHKTVLNRFVVNKRTLTRKAKAGAGCILGNDCWLNMLICQLVKNRQCAVGCKSTLPRQGVNIML